MVKIKETNVRPEILLPAELWCIKKPTGENNDGCYEIIIPLIYMTEALKKPAKFYKFKFLGLRYENGQSNKI